MRKNSCRSRTEVIEDIDIKRYNATVGTFLTQSALFSQKCVLATSLGLNLLPMVLLAESWQALGTLSILGSTSLADQRNSTVLLTPLPQHRQKTNQHEAHYRHHHNS